jgi:hypothetical protein
MNQFTSLMAMLLLVFVGMLISCADLPPGPGTEKPDTTSHNFTWQTFTLGDGNSSVLYDVVVINDTLVYAVGEIYKSDSSGNWDSIPYGLAVWNGRQWVLKKLFAQYPNRQSPSFIRPRGIFAFSEKSIWFADADVFWWDGLSELLIVHQVVNTVLSPGQNIDRLWGSSSQNLYGGGAQGGLAYFDGQHWQKLSSGTRVTINDVWGVHNSLTGERLVLCAASNKFDPGERKILRIGQQNSVDTIAWSPQRRIHSIWFDRSSALYTAGGGVFVRKENQDWSEITEIPLIFTNRIRGVGENDVFVVGDFGLVAHFNGASWHVYADAPRALYHSLNYKRDLVIAVGERNAQAVILMGKRQKGG